MVQVLHNKIGHFWTQERNKHKFSLINKIYSTFKAICVCCYHQAVYLKWGRCANVQEYRFTLSSFVASLMECWFQKCIGFGLFFSTFSSFFQMLICFLRSSEVHCSTCSIKWVRGMQKSLHPVKFIRMKVAYVWQWGLFLSENTPPRRRRHVLLQSTAQARHSAMLNHTKLRAVSILWACIFRGCLLINPVAG